MPRHDSHTVDALHHLGSRRELFVDRFLIERLEGSAHQVLHRPIPQEVVLADDRPWESSLAYFAVLLDRGVYRMYYRGYHHGTGPMALGEPMCYAESQDGVTWHKPALGLFEHAGSASTNIVLGGDPRKHPATAQWQGDLGSDPDLGFREFVPFVDTRPGTPPQARYKALIRGARGPHQIEAERWDHGMYPFYSPDGLHWHLQRDRPVITRGRFDSQNLGFWDAAHGRYVAFVRDVRDLDPQAARAATGGDAETIARGRIRDIRVSFSDDFLHWSDPVFVAYPGAPDQELYTNAIEPYERAPHLLIGFPTRFETNSAQTEPILMTSRDGGVSFHRWGEALIPREAPCERDGDRSNYMARGMVRGNAREYFVYATEGYKDGPSRRLRRFTYRVDGFVSIRAGEAAGSLLTPPFSFVGEHLFLNYAAFPGGAICAELQDEAGRPLPGLTLADCVPLTGDAIDQPVVWASGAHPGRVAGRPVRLRVAIRQADLFAIRFGSDRAEG